MSLTLISRLTLLLIPLSLVCAAPAREARAGQSPAVKARRATPRWHVPTYRGITLGKSRRRDVRRILGKPGWSGHPEDEYDNPVMSMSRDEFENVAGFDGRIAVNMRRNGVVESIELNPAYERRPSFDEFAAEFGSDFVERDDALGPCPTAAELRAYRPRPSRLRDTLVFRVYPRKGFYIALEGGRVREIVYLSRCP